MRKKDQKLLVRGPASLVKHPIHYLMPERDCIFAFHDCAIDKLYSLFGSVCIFWRICIHSTDLYANSAKQKIAVLKRRFSMRSELIICTFYYVTTSSSSLVLSVCHAEDHASPQNCKTMTNLVRTARILIVRVKDTLIHR